MDRRRIGLRAASDALLDASIVDRSGGWISLDGSGTWSWGKSRRRVHDPDNIRSQEHTPDDEPTTEPADGTEPDSPLEPEGPGGADVAADGQDGDDEPDRVRDEVADGDPDPDETGECDLLDAGGTVKPDFDPEAAFGRKTAKSGRPSPSTTTCSTLPSRSPSPAARSVRSCCAGS
jgi:hypothetical protein